MVVTNNGGGIPQRNGNLKNVDGGGMSASSYGGGGDSPNDDASAELIGGSGKGVPADTSQGAPGQDEAEEEDSGRGSASTALAVNFRPRFVGNCL